jgi:hypothetical protein
MKASAGSAGHAMGTAETCGLYFTTNTTRMIVQAVVFTPSIRAGANAALLRMATASSSNCVRPEVPTYTCVTAAVVRARPVARPRERRR